MPCLAGNGCPPCNETAVAKNICTARSCGSLPLRCSAGGSKHSESTGCAPARLGAVGLADRGVPALFVSAAARAQLAVQVLPQSLATAQELMTEQVADARIAGAWLEVRGARSEQLVETSPHRPAGTMGFARWILALWMPPQHPSAFEGCCSRIWAHHPSQDVQNYPGIAGMTIPVTTG